MILISKVDRNHLRMSDLKGLPHLKKFMDKHCNISQYVFEVKKSKDQSCFYCSGHPIRLQSEVFDSLSFLLLPRLDATKALYRPIDEVYWQVCRLPRFVAESPLHKTNGCAS